MGKGPDRSPELTREPQTVSNNTQRPERTKPSGIPTKIVYEPTDGVSPGEYDERVGRPGEFPFTRGIRRDMYRGKVWTMRQYAGYGSATETNQRFRYLLSAGQTGLSVAFDLPTQIGFDADHPMSHGEVGKVGVSVSSLLDMEDLLRDIPLDKVSTSMTINAPAAILLAMYLVVAEKQKVPWEKVSGTVQNDILKEYVARGTYIFAPEPSMRLAVDVMEFCQSHVPRWNTISISGYHIREAGATAVQELAFTLADGIAYVNAALKRGLDVDGFAPRLSFFFNAHNDFFEEIAKFRAARRMWANIMRSRFGAKNERSMQLRFHTQTAGSTLTAAQPQNNVVRVSLQALAAVLGGTQSLHTNAYDEALALPTEESVQTALRTQQIIAHETHVADTVDPLAGSYYLESLTDSIEREALRYLEEIDAMGGAVAAITSGFMQREIHRAAYETQRRIEALDQVVVGVNQFALANETSKLNLLRVDTTLQESCAKKLKELRQSRDEPTVSRCLLALSVAAKRNDNLMPPIIDAVRAYATTGEICDAMRQVFGEYHPSVF